MARVSRFAFLIIVIAMLLGAEALGSESGVSPSRLKLPQGPGSLEGVGENAEANINMGLMTYSVPIVLPEGYEGMTPNLRLGYNSGSGASFVGMGWSLPTPAIERMTSRGLPTYDQNDRFAANGGDELVALPGTNVYRARYENDFTRYKWLDRGDGAEGYWQAEHPDGRVSYFGADASGMIAPSARVAGTDGVFRYHLVETVDVHGHRVRYDYVEDGATSLLRRVRWVFSGNQARYEAILDYEVRPDHISDGKPGFDLRLSKRLSSITVKASDKQLRRYELAYESNASEHGLTRLSRVVQYGRSNNTKYPVEFVFSYSDSLRGGCQSATCQQPYVHVMGTVGANFGTGNVELIDINGDALPDVVDTTGGNHRWMLNEVNGGSVHEFAAPRWSRVADGGATQLNSPLVQMIDLNGNGFTDMIDAANAIVFWNDGSGDWARSESFADVHLPDFANNANLRFFDFDGDKTIDVIYSDETTTWYYRNLGDGTFDPTPVMGPPIGESFTNGLQLADLNGDGMQDAVRHAEGLVSYRMYLGWGRWSDWIDMVDMPQGLSSEVNFVDIDGDGLSDIVVVSGNEVRFALNENGRRFGPMTTISPADGVGIPERTQTTSVRFADMNGSGSTDVVWIDQSGNVTYLELFPSRPNLLNRIDNSIGKIIEVSYGTSVEHMARDGGAGTWQDRLPHPMLVVDSIDTWDTLSGIHQIREYRYHDGFYDGREKQFRGFGRVEVITRGDESIEEGRVIHFFNVGKEDPYYKGLLLTKVALSADRVIDQVDHEYEDCHVAEVPDDLEPTVRHVCRTATETLLREGRPESEWARIREEFDYDGYGNQTKEAQLGVVSIGGEGCDRCERDPEVMGAPCGPQCLGDEQYVETEFVSPDNAGGKWILRKPHRERIYGRPGSDIVAEKITYYDGDPFVGLSEGTLTKGLIVRVSEKVAVGEWIDTARHRHDVHGNVVELLDGNGHSRRFEYDVDGMLPTAEVVVFDAREEPYELRMELEYDPVIDEPTASTAWMLVEGGRVQTARNETSYAYDQFGRLEAIARPGDTLAVPTEEFQYDLGDPVTRIIRRARSVSVQVPDIEEVQCFDGMGRKIQTRMRLASGSWHVTGFTVFNNRSERRRTYQPYRSDDGHCDHFPPGSSLYVEHSFDAQGRVTATSYPDDAIYSSSSMTRTEFGPLFVREFDQEDSDPESPHANTPRTTWRDGLNRTVGVERLLQADQPAAQLTVTYDHLGRLRGWVTSQGHEKVQEYDLLGRVVRVDSPASGVTSFEHDATGNLVRQVDARGVVVRSSFDEAGRLMARWKDAEESTPTVYHYDRTDQCPAEICTNVAGRAVAISFPLAEAQGRDEMGYNDRGEQVVFRRTLDSHTFRVDTHLDNAGRVIGVAFPGAQSLHFELDGDDRIARVSEYLREISYAEHGPIESLEFANGVITRFDFDPMMRLASLRTTAPSGRPIQEYWYTRDRVGNITAVDDQTVLEDEKPSLSAEYSYDAFYRLVRASLESESSDAEEISFVYDEYDNLLSKTSSKGNDSAAHVGDYSYGQGAGPYALTEMGGLRFAYDAAGHLVEQGEKRLEWDHLGRLTAVADETGESTARFAYAGNEQRVRKLEEGRTAYYVTNDFEVRSGVSSIYVRVDGRRLVRIERVDLAADLLGDVAPAEQPDGQITAGDAWLSHARQQGFIDRYGSETARIEDVLRASAIRLLLDEDGSIVTYTHADHLGTPTAYTDHDGRVIERHLSYPYGAIRASHTGLEAPYGFSGKERDTTGLSYFTARYLNSVQGRWISPDPEFEILTEVHLERPFEMVNRFAYVGGNPINARDSSGRILNFVAGAGIGAVVSGGMEALRQYTEHGSIQDVGAVMTEAAVGGAMGAVTSGGSALANVGRMGAKEATKAVGRQLGKESVEALSEEYVKPHKERVKTHVKDAAIDGIGSATEAITGSEEWGHNVRHGLRVADQGYTTFKKARGTVKGGRQLRQVEKLRKNPQMRGQASRLVNKSFNASKDIVEGLSDVRDGAQSLARELDRSEGAGE